ncbi:MAG: extracellular solute-binding protein [Ruminococcaceae bacterium]|nr:extracellular solute-binding protein [Oscillospiraceae bacterium]
MKKFKAILALVLVAALFVTLFAACAQNTEKPNTDTNKDTSSNTDTNKEPAKDDNKEDAPPADDKEEDPGEEAPPVEDEEDSLIFSEDEIVNLKMIYFDLRVSGDHSERINAAINDYLEPTYGLHVDIQWMAIADMLTKVQIAIGGGEVYDLIPTLFTNSVSNLYAQKMLLPLDDLLAEYAPEALELMKDYTEVFRYDGQLYGFPVYKNWVSNNYIIMRKDILDALNLTEKAKNMTTWSEYEEIMAAVTDAYADEGVFAVSKGPGRSLLPGQGVLPHGDKFADIEQWDSFGDSGGVIYVKDGKVDLYQKQDAYVEQVLLAKKWADNGWVWPDSSLTDTHGDELIGQGVAFSNLQASEIGVEVTKGNAIGYELVCNKICSATITGGAIATWASGIPVTAEEPEAAVYLLNLLYTDAKLMNLITLGVEGEDYEIVDGQAKHNEGAYIESDFLMGNNLLLTPGYGNGADHYEKVLADIQAAPLSPYLSFSLDKSDLELVISQLTAVNDQYAATMMCGLYTEAGYQEYLSKLESAGAYDYLAAVQEQLDAWKAAQ